MNNLGFMPNMNYGVPQPQIQQIPNYQQQQMMNYQQRLQELEAMQPKPQQQPQIPPPIMVNGELGADAYQIPPNTSVALFDMTDDLFWFKQSDASGICTKKMFRYEEVKQEEPMKVEYATIGMVNELNNKIELLIRELGIGEAPQVKEVKNTTTTKKKGE